VAIRITRVQERGVVCKLFHGLHSRNVVKSLALHQVDFTGCDNGLLLQQMLLSPSFINLSLQNCTIDESMLECVARGLENPNKALRLSFIWCNLTDSYLNAFAGAIPHSSSLRELNICYASSITSMSLPTIAQLIHTQTNMQSLELMWNGALFDCDNCTQLDPFLDALKNNVSLRRLGLKCYAMSNVPVSGIFQTLEKNQTLQQLILRGNDEFSIHGSWVDSIPKLRGLRDVDLPDRLWQDPNWFSLFSALHQNTTIVQYREGFAGKITEDPALVPFLQRNKLLAHTQNLVEGQEIIGVNLWPHALHRLGSNESNDGSPIFELLRCMATEVCSTFGDSGVGRREENESGHFLC